MKRVVVTGLGIISSIGLDAKEVTESLKKENQVLHFLKSTNSMVLDLRFMVCQKLIYPII